MSYTVKQLSDLAGVSIRTLHYYDQIGLLKPGAYGENGYRYYSDSAVIRLQQIMFFKELDFNLDEIRQIITNPEFDTLKALEVHKEALQSRSRRLEHLISTIDQTILHLKGKKEMKQKALFHGFNEDQQKRYEEEIRQRYGEKALKESIDWNSYTSEQKVKIQAESQDIYQDILTHMDQGFDAPLVQQAIARWHQHLKYFYEPSIERLLGLADLYNEHPDFISMFQSNFHPEFPAFLRQAIQYYCTTLKCAK